MLHLYEMQLRPKLLFTALQAANSNLGQTEGTEKFFNSSTLIITTTSYLF